MRSIPSEVAFTPAVKAVQSRRGSRESYARMEGAHGWESRITNELAEFIRRLDMFYFATANSAGQPYVQYRGGPPGFLKVIDAGTLGFADFSGNRQYITVGNLSENPRAFIFLMDYESKRRVKLWGLARVVEDDPVLLEELSDPTYSGKPERAILFSLVAWDANCSRHIHQRIRGESAGPPTM